jgi:magnesium transporter
MFFYFYKSKSGLLKESDAGLIEEIGLENVIWVDLRDPTEQEIASVEDIFDIEIEAKEKAEEIESSSKYFETEWQINANCKFFLPSPEGNKKATVSFTLKHETLITLRHDDLRTFQDAYRVLRTNPNTYRSAHKVMLLLFEIRIDFDADHLELITDDIARMGRKINLEDDLHKEVLIEIARYQELTMQLRETIIDKQRVVSSLLKSDYFAEETYPKLRIMIKDISSLLDHINFTFSRLEYLQNAFLGLVDVEQTKIIKIFTVVTVVFMPPTLIASIYGMNFDFMPELDWPYGYPIAILLMIFSSALTLFSLKKRGWL